MNKYIELLLSERESHERQIKQIDTAIKALQNICKHTYTNGQTAMTEVGRDSHYTHFRCSECGYYEKL